MLNAKVENELLIGNRWFPIDDVKTFFFQAQATVLPEMFISNYKSTLSCYADTIHCDLSTYFVSAIHNV